MNHCDKINVKSPLQGVYKLMSETDTQNGRKTCFIFREIEPLTNKCYEMICICCFKGLQDSFHWSTPMNSQKEGYEGWCRFTIILYSRTYCLFPFPSWVAYCRNFLSICFQVGDNSSCMFKIATATEGPPATSFALKTLPDAIGRGMNNMNILKNSWIYPL